MASDLDNFFQPESIAVVGASSKESKVGYALLRNLLYGRMHGAHRREDGFSGPVYPVNHKGGEILGEKVYESLADIEHPIDLILVAIPPKYVVDLMDEAADAGLKNAIIISAGFAELGEEGKALQDRMLERARARSIRLVGPNCLGVIRPASKLNASFAESPPPAGRIGLLSQSGALITGIISYANRKRFGLSAAVSLGSKGRRGGRRHTALVWRRRRDRRRRSVRRGFHRASSVLRRGPCTRRAKARGCDQGRGYGRGRECGILPHRLIGRVNGRLPRRLRASRRPTGQ